MNYRMIKNILGWLLIFEAGFFIVPIITAAVYRERVILDFLLAALICVCIGTAFLLICKPKSKTLYSRDGFVIVSLSWIALSIFGSLPFFTSGVIPSYIDALFETVSGFTTTGASILSDVESLPRSMLIWRGFTHWVGGMGVLVFVMAFVPLSGGSLYIMKAESTGPSVGKLVPRIKTTALILYSIYFVITVIMLIFLLCGGMSLFEAVNTAFSTAGTGGFGIKNDSLGSYSPYIQYVVAAFMLIFSINFNSYYLGMKLRFGSAFNAEVRTFIIIVAVATGVVMLNISDMFAGTEEAFRYSFFTVMSLMSTTGFSTIDFNLWPELSRVMMILVMFIGGCAGSTAGGIKVSRILILCKGAIKELGQMLHPKQVKKVTLDSRPVEHEVVRSVNAYIVCYVLIFAISMILVSFDDHDLVTSFTAVSATLNNVGPGLDGVGPTQNFLFFSVPTKIVLILDMLAGRLELFPMLLLFNPSTWKRA